MNKTWIAIEIFIDNNYLTTANVASDEFEMWEKRLERYGKVVKIDETKNGDLYVINIQQEK